MSLCSDPIFYAKSGGYSANPYMRLTMKVTATFY